MMLNSTVATSYRSVTRRKFRMRKYGSSSLNANRVPFEGRSDRSLRHREQDSNEID